MIAMGGHRRGRTIMAVTTDPLSAAETAEAVRTGAVGALATLDAAFDRVGDLDPSLHSFTSLLRADGRAAVRSQQGGEGVQRGVEVAHPVESRVEGGQRADGTGAYGLGGLGGGEGVGGHGHDRTTPAVSAHGDHHGGRPRSAGSLGRYRRSRMHDRARRPAGPSFHTRTEWNARAIPSSATSRSRA